LHSVDIITIEIPQKKKFKKLTNGPFDREPIFRLLQDKIVGDFAQEHSQTYLLDVHTKLPQALKVLTQVNIHWAPVIEDQYVVGIIDLRMILSFIVSTFMENMEKFPEIPVFQELSSEETWQLTTVKQVMKRFSGELQGNTILDYSTPVLESIRLMGYGQHRFCVTKSKQFYGIFTQTDIIQFLADNLDKCGPIVNQSIEKLECGLNVVVAENWDTKVLDTLKDMDRWKIGGIAIIGKDNLLVGNLSASDLKLVLKDEPQNFECLYLSLREYIRRVRTEFPTKLGPIVSCKEYDTISTVIRIISFHQIHRIYSVSDTDLLTGVITCSNILETLIPTNCEKGQMSPQHD